MKLAKLGNAPEIFYTLQGEGVSVGCPSVFIRASRCNLHCVWCDTDHTWNFEGTPWVHEKDELPNYRKHCKTNVTIEISAKEAADLLLNYPCERFVITGGEPLLQESDFLKMIHLIREKKPHAWFEVETNGTRTPSEAFAAEVQQFNVSPKLANSGVKESLRIQPETLHYFSTQTKAWFKFVVADPADFTEVEDLILRFSIPKERVLLMPEGRTPTELNANARHLAERCRDHGYRFCDRLHVRLWGDQRGF